MVYFSVPFAEWSSRDGERRGGAVKAEGKRAWRIWYEKGSITGYADDGVCPMNLSQKYVPPVLGRKSGANTVD